MYIECYEARTAYLRNDQLDSQEHFFIERGPGDNNQWRIWIWEDRDQQILFEVSDEGLPEVSPGKVGAGSGYLK